MSAGKKAIFVHNEDLIIVARDTLISFVYEKAASWRTSGCYLNQFILPFPPRSGAIFPHCFLMGSLLSFSTVGENSFLKLLSPTALESGILFSPILSLFRCTIPCLSVAVVEESKRFLKMLYHHC